MCRSSAGGCRWLVICDPAEATLQRQTCEFEVYDLRDGLLHPTINLDAPDPACDLDYIPHQARLAEVHVALCNCIAFGSKNSALVVKNVAPAAATVASPTPAEPAPPASHDP